MLTALLYLILGFNPFDETPPNFRFWAVTYCKKRSDESKSLWVPARMDDPDYRTFDHAGPFETVEDACDFCKLMNEAVEKVPAGATC